MYIAAGLSSVVTFTATPSELEQTNREQLHEKIKACSPVSLGSDVLADMGAKVHFIGEPEYVIGEDTLITCTLHVRLTTNKRTAAITGLPLSEDHDFVAYAKCSESDKESYDLEFGKRIAMNKAKINAYAYYMRMFARFASKIHHDMTAMVGFAMKMDKLARGNAKYISDICMEKYPCGPAEEETPQVVGENPEPSAPANVIPMSASVAADING